MKKYTKTVFVFGSNREGRHGKGCAKKALDKHGAVYGQAEGLQGNSYAIVTKELRPWYPKVKLSQVAKGVRRFLEFASKHPKWKFNVTPIGCGLAGFKVEEIASLFWELPDNVALPQEFKDWFTKKFMEEC